MVGVRTEAIWTQGIQVFASAALGEMDVAFSLQHMSEQFVEVNLLMVADDRHDVPVAECPGRSLDRNCVMARAEDLSRCDGVDRSAVRSRDVDAEVEGLRTIVAGPRVVQVPTDRVLAIEGLDRPPVPRANPGTVSDDAMLCERGARGLTARGGRSVGREGEE
jgi:hypothetical protein